LLKVSQEGEEGEESKLKNSNAFNQIASGYLVRSELLGASHFLDDLALLPLFHTLVEERVGERRLDHAAPCSLALSLALPRG
jgi:hypothetical protein